MFQKMFTAEHLSLRGHCLKEVQQADSLGAMAF